jgi:hypothetical protein
MKKINSMIDEIINDCTMILSDSSYTTPNTQIIQVILSEFCEIRDYYNSNGKILLLSKGVWKLWSIRTIVDSADYGYDKGLFNKIRKFEAYCKTIGHHYITYKY